MSQKTKKKPSSKAQDYKTLREVWYKKLERSGFEDIERDEERFKRESNATQFNRDIENKPWREKSEYYYLATQFLNSHKFKSKIDKVIWEYHSNGISIRDIVDLLKKVQIKNRGRNDVFKLLKELSLEMKRVYGVGVR